jgi:hypothetical protein
MQSFKELITQFEHDRAKYEKESGSWPPIFINLWLFKNKITYASNKQVKNRHKQAVLDYFVKSQKQFSKLNCSKSTSLL